MKTAFVVAGVDDITNGLAAVDRAAEEARLRGWSLRLVHVVDPKYAAGPSRGFALLQQAAVHARHHQPGLRVSTVLGLGQPADVLLRYLDDCGLVVLGNHGHGALAGVRSSVALRLLPRVRVPVLIVRAPGLPSQRGQPSPPVVVGVDGSAGADEAVTLAAEEARLRSATLIAVHASPQPIELDREPDPLIHGPMADQDLLDGLEVSRLHVDVDPRTALIGLSRQACLVAVGGRGRGGLTGYLLGSVGQALIRRAECPVLITRPTATADAVHRPALTHGRT